jgi:DNA helicase-2/ATP-dependent DNA helicase PcrA
VKEDAALQTGWARRFQHVLVDEFQDTNLVQYQLAHTLSASSGNLCVVGDDDQSIYSWRGADLNNILEFERDHPGTEVIKLERNYRSTEVILKAANAVIAHNRTRKPKALWTERAGGDRVELVICRDERQEAAFVALSIRNLARELELRHDDFAVFYRVHAQSRALEEALRAQTLPYVLVGGIKFYERAEIKDLIAYLRLVQNPWADLDLTRIINVPRRGIGDTTVARLAAHAAQHGVSLLQACAAAVAGEVADVGARAQKPLAELVALLHELSEALGRLPVDELGRLVAERSGLWGALAADPTEEGQRRLENLREFLGSLADYVAEAEEPSLAGFLERVALVSDADLVPTDQGMISLMTVHAAKGLEFPVVFITGLEEEVFPHARSLGEREKLEEERRLAYVAITRAERRLVLTRAVERRLFGNAKQNPPSRFLGELPRELLAADRLPGAEEDDDALPAWDADPGFGGSRFGAPRPAAPPRPTARTYALRPTPAASAPGRAAAAASPAATAAARARGALAEWPVGSKVKHPSFGIGTVQACVEDGQDTKLKVFFPGHGPKVLIARFVQKLG